EAESMLWEAYSGADQNPVQSMLLSIESIRRFKELGVDVPGQARWALNQSLASQSLGISLNGFIGGVDTMTLSQDGQWFLFAADDGKVWLWDIGKHDQASEGFLMDTIPEGVAQLIITPDLNWGICVTRSGKIRLWDLLLPEPANQPIEIAAPQQHFAKVVVSADSRWMAAYGKSDDNQANAESPVVCLWDMKLIGHNLPVPKPTYLKGHEKPIRSLVISSDSRWLASGSDDRSVRIYDLKSTYPATEQIVLKNHELEVADVAISPDGAWLVTGGRDAVLRVWSLKNRQNFMTPITLAGHEGWITTLAFSNDSKYLASGGYDKTIRLWRFEPGPTPVLAHVLNGHAGPIRTLEFSKQDNLLVSLAQDREVRVWNLRQGTPSDHPLVFHSFGVPFSKPLITGDERWLILAQEKPNPSCLSGLRLWPLQFDEAYDSAVAFASMNFPSLFKSRNAMPVETTVPSSFPVSPFPIQATVQSTTVPVAVPIIAMADTSSFGNAGNASPSVPPVSPLPATQTTMSTNIPVTSVPVTSPTAYPMIVP
ncbi:MAG: WD40 repeat domain-containing protein, partial [Planctomycetaceae bacterium]|nr:WD40 repeat domain-containing protein [Planctomycetaceae bacterium]